MIQAQQLQNAYIDLYDQLRNYIWPVDVVSNIAELEINTFTTFPNTAKIRGFLYKLRDACKEERSEDETLNKSFQKFDDLLDDEIYSKLDTRMEKDR